MSSLLLHCCQSQQVVVEMMPLSFAVFIGMELCCSLSIISSTVNCTTSILFTLILGLFIGVMLNAISMLRRAGELQFQNSANDNEVTGQLSELTDDVLSLITNKLHFMEDYVRFGAVCRSWHQIFLEKEKSSNSKLPWLMLRDEANDSLFRFYSPFNNKVFAKLLLPELREMRCWGSNHGWLVSAGMDACITLLNPLSGDHISLPAIQIRSWRQEVSVPCYCYRCVHKVVVSSGPRASGVVVMAIYSHVWRLAWIKPGNFLWTPIESITIGAADIIYYANKFFVIDFVGRVLIFSGTGEHIQTLVAAGLPDVRFQGKHIVEFGEKIYAVIKLYALVFIDGVRSQQATDILVFEVDEADQRLRRVYSLAEWALFLEYNSSFAMYALDYPEIRRNCVYFIDQTRSGGAFGSRLGIYSLEDDLIEWQSLNLATTSRSSPPLWMRPSLE